jgi:hypothetical protein
LASVVAALELTKYVCHAVCNAVKVVIHVFKLRNERVVVVWLGSDSGHVNFANGFDNGVSLIFDGFFYRSTLHDSTGFYLFFRTLVIVVILCLAIGAAVQLLALAATPV